MKIVVDRAGIVNDAVIAQSDSGTFVVEVFLAEKWCLYYKCQHELRKQEHFLTIQDDKGYCESIKLVPETKDETDFLNNRCITSYNISSTHIIFYLFEMN